MSTTASQTWVRRAGRYFTDTVPGFTYRISPALGTAWAVSRCADGQEGVWESYRCYSSLAQAKKAVLTGEAFS